MMAKRANMLRVQAAAMTWGERGARVNALSPGIIVTPLARHELESEIGDIYRGMVAESPPSAWRHPMRLRSQRRSCSARTPASSPAPTC